jgi:hypothetical protein
MGFLKSIGQALLKVTKILAKPDVQAAVRVGEGVVSALVPGSVAVFSELNQLAGLAIQAEASVEAINAAKGGTPLLTGADKLTAALPLASQVILASQIMDGKKIKDEAAFTAAVRGLMSNTADLLNSLEAK